MKESFESIISELKARQDIHDALVRYCRGADLCNAAMMQSCYHDDAIDDHGFFNGSGHEFAKRAAGNLAALFSSTRHFMTNEYVELNGDAATSEVSILCQMRLDKDGEMFDVTARCRYLDRFERRDSVWKIAHRQLVSDGTRVEKVIEEFPLLNQGAPGKRGADDPAVAFFARYANG